MADRNFHKRESQGIRHVEYSFRVKYVAGAPQFVEGDTLGALAGSYVTISQTGTGNLKVKTNNPFPGFVGLQYGWSLAAPTGNSIANQGLPVQAADGTWSISLNTYTNAGGTHSAANPLNGDELHVTLILRNSTVLP
jgi:hypothetical protein